MDRLWLAAEVPLVPRGSSAQGEGPQSASARRVHEQVDGKQSLNLMYKLDWTHFQARQPIYKSIVVEK